MSNNVDNIYTWLAKDIAVFGEEIPSRNAITRRQIGLNATFNQTPLVTIRRTAWKNALREFEWFLSGSEDISTLHKSVHPWWKPWAKNDIVCNNYSRQFRAFFGKDTNIDQLELMIDLLIKDPYSRRNVITTWNTADMFHKSTPITNCHGTVIQAFVSVDNKVHLTMYQRSADFMLGVPHNWIQYWAFLMFLAHRSGREVGSFNWIGGDVHIYPDHLEMAENMYLKYTEYSIKGIKYDIPELIYKPTSKDFKADDFSLSCEYDPIIKESLKMTV